MVNAPSIPWFQRCVLQPPTAVGSWRFPDARCHHRPRGVPQRQLWISQVRRRLWKYCHQGMHVSTISYFVKKLKVYHTLYPNRISNFHKVKYHYVSLTLLSGLPAAEELFDVIELQPHICEFQLHGVPWPVGHRPPEDDESGRVVTDIWLSEYNFRRHT